jgi:hypothetical protein
MSAVKPTRAQRWAALAVVAAPLGALLVLLVLLARHFAS